MPKLFLALVGLALVVSSRAAPLQNYFKDASLKSLGQSEFDAVNAAVKALPEHPILAQVLAGVRHQELRLYLKLGKYIKDYRDDLDKLTIHAARDFLLLYSYIYELGSYLYLRGPPLYAEADSLDYYYFLKGRYAQLSPDARKQVDDVLPKIVQGIKGFGEELPLGAPEKHSELIRLFDDELGKSITAEELSVLKHVVSELSDTPIVEVVKEKVKAINPKTYAALSEVQKFYHKTLNSLSTEGARTFLRTTAYTFEALAFLAIRYDNSLVSGEDSKFVLLGLLKRYNKLSAEDKNELKKKVPDLAKIMEEIRKHPPS
ncbi:hypothetical protein AAVH_01237 [Aphelenchoides avenae]|nr:hypothetical protein AAVH_01237 [Aphelenchus avenae]